MDSNTLREKFLTYFKSKNHKILNSDSLVPVGDLSVLFTSAGMNQFKSQFLGVGVIYPRVATCQKCLRTDDLDKVGQTCGHHTFFEMLGNFSFGDYFKKEAISFAWEFLTNELGIAKNKLWVSVYESDDESFDIWQKEIGVEIQKIVKLGDKQNFWPSEAKTKGPNGPCGPCSEIFFDLGKEVGCAKVDCTPACNCGRFLEVWNLVFTSFERKPDASLLALSQKNIDTGMGLERLAAVMQEANTNFETDLFIPIINEVLKLAPQKINLDSSAKKFRLSAIADHIRAICFAITDGVYPSNEDRGYVIRNLIRRAFIFGKELGINGPFLFQLVDTLGRVMHKPYPEILDYRDNISQIIRSEEERFISTLELRMPEFCAAIKELAEKNVSEVPVDILFKFYDTFGLPWDLMEAEAKKFHITCNKEKFSKLLDKQRKQSRDKSKLSSSIFGKLYDFKRETIEFIDCQSVNSKVIAIFRDEAGGKKSLITKAAAPMLVEIVLDKTCFYAESGGQIGDTGVLENERTKIEIMDTKTIDGTIVHFGKMLKGEVNVNDNLCVTIDAKRRLAIMRNHTATHLLQAALRNILGNHVRQQGSLVTDKYLRFDFTHPKAIKKEELERIEELVNEFIMADDPLKKEIKSLAEAKKSGALAFFDQRYADTVKVVSINDYSKELCGGSHLDSTGQVGYFRIISESSIASGIRRLEACTGAFAVSLGKIDRAILNSLSKELNASSENLTSEVQNLKESLKNFEKELSVMKLDTFRKTCAKFLEAVINIDGVNVVSGLVDNCDYELMRKIADELKTKVSQAIIILGSIYQNRALIIVSLTPDLVKQGFLASEIVKPLANSIGGSGGGTKQLAQAGSSNVAGLAEFFKNLKQIIEPELKK
jgi:alanyl-tRNA synthetase